MTEPSKRELLFWSLDLEMEQPSNEIISVGIAWETAPGVTEKKDILITPSNPISQFIQELTGLKDEMYNWEKSRAECFTEVYDLLTSIFSNRCTETTKMQSHVVVWGQGDLHTLRKQFFECMPKDPSHLAYSLIPKRFIDTKQIMWFNFTTSGKSSNNRMSLVTALKHMRMNFDGNAHNSADDAENTLLLFRRLFEAERERRKLISSLNELN